MSSSAKAPATSKAAARLKPAKPAPPPDQILQKLINDEARRLNTGLEERAELQDAELRSVRAEMESFAYSISHDLRAPLVHIGGFVDLLFNHFGSKIDEKGRHYLRTIAESTYQMGRMIDDVLALSRVSRAELNRVRIDLHALAQGVVDELRPLAENRMISWLVGELPVVEADPTLMRQVFVQLASNAVKFTRPRDVARIQIGGFRGEHESILFVRDNGVGFSMKHRDKLFGVFQRLHAASEFEGTGVGLVYVRRIIQRHGGKTWAESAPGEGATFFFSLPDSPPASA